MTKKDNLDFICIGAAKSGTTTLHEILKDHPEISLPPAKEVPFYNYPAYIDKGLDWYLEQNFNKAKDGSVWGTITPQYMYSRNGFTPQKTAKNIKKLSPDTQIIMILRHPITRTFSHYKTAVRRNGVDMTFAEAMTKELKNAKTNKVRNGDWDPVQLSFYGSEYAKILEPYYKLFDKKNIKVLFFEDLISDPQKVVADFCTFIGVDPSYEPSNIGGQFNANGSKPKIALLTPKYLHNSAIRKAWHVFPYRFRKMVEVKVNSWNAKVDNEKLDKSSDIYKQLWKYFSKDIKKLEGMAKVKTPWKS